MGDGYPNFRRSQREGGSYRRPRGTRPSRRETSFASQLIGTCLTVGAITFAFAPEIQSFWSVATQPTERVEAVESSVYYQNCEAARAKGAAPIYRGSPGYRDGIDGDSDGVACEPFR